MNTAISISEYASVGTGTGLTVPMSATTPTTMKGAVTTEAATSQRQVPARIGRAQLQVIAERLDATDRALLALLAAHRYATTRQLAQITELSGQYGSARSALRQTSRRLRRQHGLGLVAHLARRIGGTRAGSAGYVWYLTAAGQRLTGEGRGVRRRFQEPSALFLAHTLAITQARVVIKQAIHAASERTVLAATADKFPGSGLLPVLPVTDLQAVITTVDPSTAPLDTLAGTDTEVVLA